MKLKLLLILLLLPAFVNASCIGTGTTVVYVNGILASLVDAQNDLFKLNSKFLKSTGDRSVKFINGYNESHIAGFGDLIESASQSLGFSVSNYDLNTILLQIYPEITTRKILLVGHSQGTFYTNEIYQYLTQNGEPNESVAVYNVATPATFVAGNGLYITSKNDKVVNDVRHIAERVGVLPPLQANIDIPLTVQEAADPYGGHSFSGVYLANAAGRIVAEIGNSLGKLTAGNLSDTRDAGCFTPPAKNFSYRVQQALFTAGDPLASGAVSAAKVSFAAERAVGDALAKTMIAAAGGIKDAASLILTFGQNAPPSSPPVSQVSAPQNISTPTSVSAPAPQLSDNTGPPKQPPSALSADSVGGAPDTVLAENAALSLTPDPAITNNPLPSGGGASGGSLGSISAPGAGAAPTNTVTVNPANANQQNQTESSTSTPPSSPPPPPPDITPPDIAFAINECSGASLSSDGCLLANSAIHLSWSSAASDLAHFEISCEVNSSPCAGFSFSPTGATSTQFTLIEENKSYTFKAKAIDTAGNISSEVTRTVVFSARPVVINEVAWMGTGSSATTSKDEWLELYNPTNYSVNLSGWTISFYKPATTTPAHTIMLSNTIPAKGFYLIERTNDNAIVDVAADLTSSFGTDGLLNTGMIVKLEREATLMDRTPELCQVGFSLTWCAGSSLTYQTMERIDPISSGEVSSNWGTALGEFILNGINADGNPIKGTPKKRNSINYLISQNETLLQNKTLAKAGSPYLINRYGLTIAAGATLTIDPGVVVKFVSNNEPSLVVNGTIQSSGTAVEPIVFTSFLDDAYGGDMNADGICNPGNASSTAACPSPGGWMQVRINSSSAGSRFDNTIFRYGGRWFTNMTIRAMVVVDGTSVTFQNSTFEYSQKHGLYLNNSDSSVETDNTFRNNNADSDSTGLYTTGGSPTVRQNTFSSNSYGFYIVGGAAPQVTANTFSQNTGRAITSVASPAIFSGNAATNNGINGIIISGVPLQSYTFRKDLPYVVDGAMSQPNSAVFTFEPGVIVKGKSSASWSIGGKFVAEGTAAEPIIFTSFQDDVGGDTNNDGICDPGNASSTSACPSPGNWSSLNFNSTSASSTLKHAVVRYGSGYVFCGFSGGAVVVNGTSVEIADTVFEKNKAAGLWLTNSASTTVSSTVFREHQGSDCAVGLKLTDSSVMLNGVSFTNNRLGIYAESSSSVILGAGGVTFYNNTASTSPANLIP